MSYTPPEKAIVNRAEVISIESRNPTQSNWTQAESFTSLRDAMPRLKFLRTTSKNAVYRITQTTKTIYSY